MTYEIAAAIMLVVGYFTLLFYVRSIERRTQRRWLRNADRISDIDEHLHFAIETRIDALERKVAEDALSALEHKPTTSDEGTTP